jgi:hypothetical protein
MAETVAEIHFFVPFRTSRVMAGLVPAIHAFNFAAASQDVDARDKRGHNE